MDRIQKLGRKCHDQQYMFLLIKSCSEYEVVAQHEILLIGCTISASCDQKLKFPICPSD